MNKQTIVENLLTNLKQFYLNYIFLNYLRRTQFS